MVAGVGHGWRPCWQGWERGLSAELTAEILPAKLVIQSYWSYWYFSPFPVTVVTATPPARAPAPAPATPTHSMLFSKKSSIHELTVGVMGAAPLPSANPRPDATYLTVLSAVHSGAPLMPSPASYRKRRSPLAAVHTSSDMLKDSNHMLPSGLSTAGIQADSDEGKGSALLVRMWVSSGVSSAALTPPLGRHVRKRTQP